VEAHAETAPKTPATGYRSLLGSRAWRRRQMPIALAWVLTLVLFAIVSARSPGFASSSNIESVIQQAGIVGIIAIGQTLVILTGGIDLSIPGMMSVAGVVLAREASTNGDLWRPVLIVLLIALVVGLINGVAVGIFRAPAIIVTLGMNGVLSGALLVVVQGGTGRSSGAIPSGVRDAAIGQLGPIPAMALIWIVLTVIVTLVLSRTSYGKRIYAIGNNAVAARVSGVNVPLTLVSLYMISAVTAALGGFLLAGYLNQSYPSMGSPYLFTGIAAALVGGASILGGSGNYLGTVAGALTLTILNGLLAILNLGPEMVRILYGAVIFLTVLASTYFSNRGGRRSRE
jgi:ribose transport system permease protein